MRVGVPKEIKAEEYRVGLTPASVREYVSRGHHVFVERGAGDGIGTNDGAYLLAGAEIVDTAEEVFAIADLIVKVKEPQASQWSRMRSAGTRRWRRPRGQSTTVSSRPDGRNCGTVDRAASQVPSAT